MDYYIRKLPLLMALTGALIVGTVGYTQKVPDKENMLKMVITMIIFYIVGNFIRDTTNSILEANRTKAEEERQELMRKEKEKHKEEIKNKRQVGMFKGLELDLVADDEVELGNSGEEFEALPVAEFIKNELKR